MPGRALTYHARIIDPHCVFPAKTWREPGQVAWPCHTVADCQLVLSCRSLFRLVPWVLLIPKAENHSRGFFQACSLSYGNSLVKAATIKL